MSIFVFSYLKLGGVLRIKGVDRQFGERDVTLHCLSVSKQLLLLTRFLSIQFAILTSVSIIYQWDTEERRRGKIIFRGTRMSITTGTGWSLS